MASTATSSSIGRSRFFSSKNQITLLVAFHRAGANAAFHHHVLDRLNIMPGVAGRAAMDRAAALRARSLEDAESRTWRMGDALVFADAIEAGAERVIMTDSRWTAGLGAHPRSRPPLRSGPLGRTAAHDVECGSFSQMRYMSPFYMGHRLSGLEVPEPYELIEPDLPDGSEMERMAALYDVIATRIASDESFPVLYAGDCCAILGVIAGLQRKGVDSVLVFYDAHGDFNTWETTPSNFIGGMPLAIATGRGEQTIVDACGMQTLSDTDTFLVDGRDLDPAETELLAASDVTKASAEEIIDAIPSDRPLYVHID
ncbi:MAG: arginase family protein, partial [Acidimicrobiia bacterium]|nr:arginase family protein [Acidimicrobiia bacterium]